MNQANSEATRQLTNGYDQIRTLADADMRQVDQLIGKELHSDVVLINQIGHHIIRSGGKRLRPMLVVLAARACGYAGQHHHTLAAVIEFIHTATLLHDDVVDSSDMRRGQSSANALFGNAASVLSGDFLYSRAFQLMVRVNSMPVQQVLADTTNRIAEGEVLQLLCQHNPGISEQRYMDVIEAKTACLFSAAARLGAFVADSPEEQQRALAEYGHQLGLAFQITDDMLDYSSSAGAMGKNAGDDLAEGKPTLPFLLTLPRASEDERKLLCQSIENGDASALEDVIAIMERHGALAACGERVDQATARAIEALQTLPPSPWRDALETLAMEAARREQ